MSCWGRNDSGQVMLFVFEGGCCVMREGRDVFVADEVFCFRVQLGDGTMFSHSRTPVSVSGLGSGVAMIALGGVRFVAIASGRCAVLERSVCI